MTMPGFTAENALNGNGPDMPARFRSSGSAPQFASSRRSVVQPAIFLPPSCLTLCPHCNAAGGDCLPVGNGRCYCI